ncbi:hypothetical protein N7468_005873 [Penicillium chermesinum]|uniref:Uncharacterized protein n=1 Tax=Penicillium chermesinum TaxID=63820 RepID=A0A9W9P2G4_9EURO|nr:uncharacterized protein N7468_005873 [Penicillium chermesinum]KAJ5232917.1 hypothetical protein N7468_005873 [Penicillium chermesinum]
MRSTLRLLANVKPRYLEPFAPTGLTGLHTHPSPRPTLIYLYTSTLEKLKAFPESSAYRQSVEALSRHRLQIVEAQKPPGFEAWLERVRKTVAEEPERFAKLKRSDGSFAFVGMEQRDGSDITRGEEWDGEGMSASTEGPTRTPEEEAELNKILEAESAPPSDSEIHNHTMKWEKRAFSGGRSIGAGLIEEVIQVAEAESKLVDELYKAKVWEELEENPSPANGPTLNVIKFQRKSQRGYSL